MMSAISARLEVVEAEVGELAMRPTEDEGEARSPPCYLSLSLSSSSRFLASVGLRRLVDQMAKVCRLSKLATSALLAITFIAPA